MLKNQQILLCRSTLTVSKDLFKGHDLRCVATASSGTDHIDHNFLIAQDLQIIDAKGANAPAVADYVLASLAYLETQHLVQGKKAGIIGFGRVGEQVQIRLATAGFAILKYDPLKEVHDPSFKSCTIEELYTCNILCIHAELHDNHPYPSKNIINDAFLRQLNPGTIIINAARGGIVNEEAFLDTQSLLYCTDVFTNEPRINSRIIEKSILCTPHIAGHSREAKFAAVAYVSKKLHQYLNLPLPNYATPQQPTIIEFEPQNSWQEQILAVYNPHLETKEFKKAIDKTSAFLNLRKNHNRRHDFSVYFAKPKHNTLQQLLGFE